jgi:pSer/pThr/pTyr-binding forkhead associated (FHA) protein
VLARLVALDQGPDILVDEHPTTVGRHPACTARLDSLRVSRHHCCLSVNQEDGRVVVRDLGSTNGVRINGMRVESGRLQPGDELSIAHLRYRFERFLGGDGIVFRIPPPGDPPPPNTRSAFLGPDW